MVERILELTKAVGFTPGQSDDLAVALAEALSNAAVHGNQLRPRTYVGVMVEVVPHGRAVIEVKDGGPGFDASDLGDPTEAERILSPGGRGVFLMRQLVDKVEFEGGGNRVRLTKRR